jgi:hypothetical protein
MAGYSGTPLAKKLGIKEGSRVFASRAPKTYRALLAPLPAGVQFATKMSRGADVVHIFATAQRDLTAALRTILKTLRSDASIWVSWPKKSAKVPTDITEDVIRDVALPMGLVDIKVCAVDETWSGLKLVIRRERRKIPRVRSG